jgi:predicted RNA-binding protein with PUA domain
LNGQFALDIKGLRDIWLKHRSWIKVKPDNLESLKNYKTNRYKPFYHFTGKKSNYLRWKLADPKAAVIREKGKFRREMANAMCWLVLV